MMSARRTNSRAAELELVRELARTALAALERERQRIDGLNVYPVPDGDTGTNLVATMRALVEELEQTEPASREHLRANLARALLMQARGCSGVVLSQIVRGLVEAVPASGPVDGRALAAMLERARDAARAAVARPAEGTILTLMRELTREARSLKRVPMPVGGRLYALVARGEAALERTREQNPVLREAGVVDAGTAGVLVCLRAIARVVSGADAAGEARRLRAVSS
jgi:dihydroxyacetone kinase-like predicted kinase